MWWFLSGLVLNLLLVFLVEGKETNWGMIAIAIIFALMMGPFFAVLAGVFVLIAYLSEKPVFPRKHDK